MGNLLSFPLLLNVAHLLLISTFTATWKRILLFFFLLSRSMFYSCLPVTYLFSIVANQKVSLQEFCDSLLVSYGGYFYPNGKARACRHSGIGLYKPYAIPWLSPGLVTCLTFWHTMDTETLKTPSYGQGLSVGSEYLIHESRAFF